MFCAFYNLLTKRVFRFDFRRKNLSVAPDFYHYEAYQGSANVGKVGDIIPGKLTKARNEFN